MLAVESEADSGIGGGDSSWELGGMARDTDELS